jgi:hypothetical protein
MNKIIRKAILVLTVAYVWPLSAEPTTYAFDTVTAVKLDQDEPVVAGIQKGTGANLAVTFRTSPGENEYVVNRCVTLFLMALEKPGRYYLYVTVDPSNYYWGLKSCQLNIKQ